MFVMISSGDNPRMVFLIILVQMLVPLLQSGSSDSIIALSLPLVLLFGIIILKLYPFFKNLYARRDQLQEADGAWEYIVETFRHTQVEAQQNAQRQQAEANAARNSDPDKMNEVLKIIQKMPMEEYMTGEDLKKNATIHELKERLKRREVKSNGCVEREELVDLLIKYRGGPSANNSCCICCEDYQAGDIMRLLPKCKHEFHLECLDKWAYTSANQHRNPSCPLCNQQLE
jgi:hypothetical protein